MIYKNYVYKYHLYTYVYEGDISWESWCKLSPKALDIFEEVIKDLREMKVKAKEMILKQGN